MKIFFQSILNISTSVGAQPTRISLARNSGFALLYSVLVASLFLAIGSTIASATLKNLIFASSGRESQFAFYSADSGVECALYWDKIGNDFATSSISTEPLARLKCNDEVLDVTEDKTPTYAVSTFYIGRSDIPYVNGALCVQVIVTKEQDEDDPSIINTTIISNGYNTCDETSPRRLQRSLLVEY